MIYGNAASIDGMIERMEEELGCKCTIVATGGLAQAVIPHCRHNIIIDEDLLLKAFRLSMKRTDKDPIANPFIDKVCELL